MSAGIYDTHLDKTSANHVPLSPLSFLARTADVYPARTACVHGNLRRTYAELYARCRRLASALARRGIGKGDTVAVMLPNVPPMLEAHFGVPMTGAVLNSLNYRLDAKTLAFTLDHGEAKVLITDREFSGVIKEALTGAARKPLVIDFDDPEFTGKGERLGNIEYEEFLKDGDPNYAWRLPEDEWQGIALNYTSGTTGNPKGVVYHHRGAYLNAMGNVVSWGMPKHATYLWTLPMFHCNGWCFPWTVTAIAGVHVCLRRVEAPLIFDAIRKHGVDHFCGAPIVLNMIVNAPPQHAGALPRPVKVMTAAAPPPPAILQRMEAQGFRVTHVYGLTESYGPVTVCAWHDEWDALPADKQAEVKSRQGVRYEVLEGLMVADPRTMQPVPKDGKTMGEVFMRGNVVMKGYLKNPKATEDSLAGGWFHTGDLGVWDPDGYIALKDRSKDIIISGGENISTIEVEGVLYQHPGILEAAVVARPDEKWGETPCAFVTLKPGASASAEDIIQHCRKNLAGYKVPKTVVFGTLPKTSTGKVQKFILREQAQKM
jgi:fatty-acyl-CoA synthase